MEKNALFVAASRCKLRIPTTKGPLAVEDLWDLSLKSLDEIAVKLDAKIQPSRKSFLDNPDPKKDAQAEADMLALEIIKVIIGIKQEENKAAREASSKAAQIAFLRGLKEKKRMEALEGLSMEEIDKQITELNG